MATLYDDGAVCLDSEGLTIRRYFPWGGSKRIAYRDIESIRRRNLRALTGKWRLWGSGDLVHWWSLDLQRPRRREVFEIDTGNHWIATITPADPEQVGRILSEHAV